MEFSLQEKIEVMRREPEHVRMRYVIVCVSVTMILIFGVWLLAVEDSVTTAIQDVPGALEKGKGLTGGAPSLNELFEQATPLRIDDKNTKSDGFFQQQRESQNTEANPIPAQ
jgi:hypothetical protein